MTATTIRIIDPEDDLAHAERAVLGASLMSPAAFDRCAAMLTGKDFFDPAHEIIWEAIAAVSATGTAAEPVRADLTLVVMHLHREGQLAQVGGGAYVHSLFSDVVTPVNATWYARIVLDAAKNRRLRDAGLRLTQAAQLPLTPAERDAAIEEAEAAFDSIAGGDVVDPYPAMGTTIDATLERVAAGRVTGVETGLRDLDEIVRGFVGGQVIVVGARPRIGKSVLATQVALNVARTGAAVLSFNLEMSRDELNLRLLSNLAGVNSRALNLSRPEMSEDDWDRVAHVAGEFADLPIYLSDQTDLTPARLNALIGSFKRKHPDLGLVTVDYLQLMGSGQRSNNRQEEVSYISREIKKAAKRHNVPIMILSQLNRGSEQRTDRLPQMSDLRESGAVEQDADVVVLLHREDAYDRESPRAGEMDLIVAKNRNGESGTATVAAQLHYFRLSDLAHGYDRAVA